MRGMTGFGRAEYATEEHRIAVELKSYNSRYLEIQVHVPPGYGELEPRLRALVAERVGRGRVELALSVADLADTVQVRVDAAAARAYLAALQELADVAGGGPVTLSNLLAVGGFLEERRERFVEQVWRDCTGPLDDAFAQFDAACRHDGSVTAADLRRLLAEVEGDVEVIEAEAPQAAQRQRDAIAARAQELLAGAVDEDRLIAALATLLAKSDVNEELIRLRGHLGAFRDALAGGERAKKLEFISQEMMREANTVAAKGAAFSISAAAVRVKDAIERIREHLRNVA
jgi:uncharacterized protein (TIGR00255 family)